MKSQYKRDISKEYFRPLKSFCYRSDYHPSVANNKQIELAEKLSKDYGIHEGNILRLIMYADIAWSYATDSEIQFYYSDMTEIGEFEKEPFPIDKIVFRGSDKPLGYRKSFEITNPYLIDKLYNSMLDFMDFQKVLKEKKTDTKKKRPSAKIIKLIATEIYNELTGVEKITGSRPLYITGYIFGLCNIGIKKNNYILNQEQHKQEEDRKADEAYTKYINERKKSFKSMGVQPGDVMNRVEFDLNRKTNKTRESYLQYLNGRMRKIVNC